MIIIFDRGEYDAGILLLHVPKFLDLPAVEALLATPGEVEGEHRHPPRPRVVAVTKRVQWRNGAGPMPLHAYFRPVDFFVYVGPHFHDLTRDWVAPPLTAGQYATVEGEDTAIWRCDGERWAALTPQLARWFLSKWELSHATDVLLPLFRSVASQRFLVLTA